MSAAALDVHAELPPVLEAGGEPVARLRAAISHQAETVLAGCAGTGKTTMLGQLLADPSLDPYVVAPTARAAARAREVTGKEANTVHSFVYDQPIESWQRPDGTICRKPQRPCGECSCTLQLSWPARERAPMRVRPGVVPLIVVDESSMISEELASALRSRVRQLGERAALGARILWVGDPAQLPPVGGPPGVQLGAADVLLQHVWRSDRPAILDLATRIRHATSAAELLACLQSTTADGVRISATAGWAEPAAWRAERPARMLIVRRNRDRLQLNADVRAARNRLDAIGPGERLLVRANSREAGVYNGELHVVRTAEIDRSGTVARVECADGAGAERTFSVVLQLLASDDRDAFYRQRRQWPRPWGDAPLVNAQYGYALTCHAAQGSEAGEVGVVWTGADTWLAARDPETLAECRAWLYTAVTRAKRSISIWRVTA